MADLVALHMAGKCVFKNIGKWRVNLLIYILGAPLTVNFDQHILRLTCIVYFLYLNKEISMRSPGAVGATSSQRSCGLD